ncbi:MAG: GNAT family N-acetyltransferase [Haliscomenobacter sp.]
MPTFALETNRLQLLACDEPLCRAILKGDNHLGEFLQTDIAADWNSFGMDIFQFNLDRILEDPGSHIWWSYLVIERSHRTLIGACGYKGRPNKNGEVEIGYEIASDFRNQGYATELTQALIQHAGTFPEISTVKAYTLSAPSPSTQVLTKCGFSYIQEMYDPEDGILWQWKRNISSPV